MNNEQEIMNDEVGENNEYWTGNNEWRSRRE